MTILLVVESPSKARTIKKYVGADFVVRPTIGHIIDLSKGRGDLGVSIENGFKPKYAVLPDKQDVVEAIQAAAKQADQIYIASDMDREGEAIAFHVASVLKKFNKPIRRVKFHEITKKAIEKAIANPTDLDQNLYDAQQARRVLDRIVGFTVSPYLSRKLTDNMSAGRVQSVALRLIVDREKEIEAFIPEEYWDVTVRLAKTAKSQSFDAYPVKKILDEKTANQITEDLKSCKYEILNVKAEQKPRNPCPPLITSELQKDASARFRFPVDKTMKIAQSLYENGLVTYIRTDSVRCSPEAIDSARQWLLDNNYDVPVKFNVYKNKDDSQDAHEAIRPTDVTLEIPALSEDELKIYRLIRAKFLGSQMLPALYDTVKVLIGTSAGHQLETEGKVQAFPGWLAICQEFEKTTKEITLPKLNKGDSLVLVPPKVVCEKKETKPPSRFNEGSLIDELKRKGIGRPSTYAAIIAKITKYVNKTARAFVPTELGRKVVDDLQQYFAFMAYEYTAKMEDQLDLIAEGKLGYEEMLGGFYEPFKSEFNKARYSEARKTDIPCPICGGETVVKHSQYGFFAGCWNYPDCRGAVGIRFEGDEIICQPQHEVVQGVNCPDCGLGMVRRDGRFGPFYSCSNYPRCKGRRKIPFGKKCSKCGGELYLTIFNGEQKLACMNYPDCKNIENIPEDTNTNWISPEEIKPPKLSRKVERLLKKKSRMSSQ